MKTVRWGTPSEVAQYEFQNGRRYSEDELRDLAAKGKIRSEGGDGSPLRVGYTCIQVRARTSYDLDWLPTARMRTSPDDDHAWEQLVEPPPPDHELGSGGKIDLGHS